MTIQYNVIGKDRKKLVTAISTELATEANYLGAPKFEFEVGGYIISQNGTVTGPDSEELAAALAAQGFTGEAEYEPAEAAITKPDKTELPWLYTLKTPRGEIYIREEFTTHDEAAAEGYGEYFSTALGGIYSYGDNRTFALVASRKAGDWETTTMGGGSQEPPL